MLALLRLPGVRRLVVASLVARLPLGMGGLAILLLVREAGFSYATAGAVVAAFSVASAAGTPGLARLVDRLGQTRVLLVSAGVYAVALCALVALAVGGAPAFALGASAALAGASLPPVAACIRALWPTIVGAGGPREAAFALEATLQELFFIVGPLLVAVLGLLASAAAATLATAAFGLLGTLAFVTAPAARAAAASDERGLPREGRLLTPGLRTLLVGSAAMGVVFGVLEVAMPAFAEDHGARSAGAFALAAASLGSLAGGLWAGARPSPRPARRYVVALAALALATVPLLLAPSIPAMVALALLFGIPIAPAFAAAYGLLDELAPVARATEAFAWNSTAIVAGASGGTALAGVAVGHGGVDLALAIGLAASAAGALVAFARRATLSRA